MRKNQGFTLIELMIVVAIIGILTAIAAPSYTEYLREAGRRDAMVGLQTIADRQERYYLQNNTYTTVLTDLNASSTSDQGLYTFKMTSADASGFEISAAAIASEAQINDTGCTTMTLSSTGVKTPDGPAPAKECW